MAAAIDHGLQLADDGADILDVGGDSAWGGAADIDPQEERRRVVPVVDRLARGTSVPISVDTYRASTAAAVLGAGATMVNDITGFADPEMTATVARAGASVCLTHMKGAPKRYPADFGYRSLLEVTGFLARRVRRAVEEGIGRDRIVVDPGIEFGKLVEHDLELLRRLDELHVLGYPVLVAVSRKAFIGNVLGLPAEERLEGTAAAVAFAVHGANIVRVHDVRAMTRVVRMTEALVGGRFGSVGLGMRSDGHVVR